MWTIIEPVKLIGAAKYNLNGLKEIKVTESYLGLQQNVRGCQNEEELYNCTTKYFKDTMLEQCGCIPLDIAIEINVMLIILMYGMIMTPFLPLGPSMYSRTIEMYQEHKYQQHNVH